MRRPSFGSRTKREIELKVFELLYGDRIAEGTVTVGDVAEELAVTRARARSLLLETRTRLAAEGWAEKALAFERAALGPELHAEVPHEA